MVLSSDFDSKRKAWEVRNAEQKVEKLRLRNRKLGAKVLFTATRDHSDNETGSKGQRRSRSIIEAVRRSEGLPARTPYQTFRNAPRIKEQPECFRCGRKGHISAKCDVPPCEAPTDNWWVDGWWAEKPKKRESDLSGLIGKIQTAMNSHPDCMWHGKSRMVVEAVYNQLRGPADGALHVSRTSRFWCSCAPLED